MAAAMIEQPTPSPRRNFLKAAGAALVTGFPAIVSAQTVTNAIKVGLVGCGGRATDAPGIRSVLDTAGKAKEKNLSLVAGFCWRYNSMIQDTFKQMEDGAIGKLTAYYATYYTNPVKPMPPASSRPAGMSDIEWQIRNWYNFVYLGGDSLVEQAVHSVDKIAWAMHDEPPVSCVGVGGRNSPNEGGNIYDHFEINYSYPNGVRAFLGNRQIV